MPVRTYLELHFIVFLWGFTAVLGVLIQMPALELVLYRTLFSAIGIGILLLVSGNTLLIDRRSTLQLLGTGVLFAIHWILFFGSAKVSNVSVLLVGMSTVTFFTAVVDPIMNKKRISKLEVGLGLLIILGIYIVFRADFDYYLGFSMAIGASICAAIFTVLNGRFAKKTHHYHVMGYEMAGAFVICFLFALLMSQDMVSIATFEASDYIYMSILVIVCTLYAYSASVKLMKEVSPFLVNLTISLEPLYGIALALLIFGDSEKMNANFYLGGGLILLAVFIYPVAKRRLNKDLP